MSTCHPHISVIVACRNEKDSIRACISSALSQEGIAGDLEVICVDGNSIDGTVEIIEELCKRYPNVVLRHNAAGYVASGLNLGIKFAKGDVIVRMDAHTEYAPDYVRMCLQTLNLTGADNVGGQARTSSKTYVQRAVAAAYHSRASVGGALFHNTSYTGWVDTVPYGCWHKEAFVRFGLFDEDLIRNQDDEHNQRIIRQGGKVWQSADIRSWYSPRSSLTSLFAQYMQYGYWKVEVIRKHRGAASLRHLIPVMCIVLLTLLALVPLYNVAVCAVTAIPGVPMFPRWVIHADLLCVVVLGVSYICLVSAASFECANRAGWDLLPILPLTFPCYHFGYSYGFIRGILDFCVFTQRRKGVNFNQLTR